MKNRSFLSLSSLAVILAAVFAMACKKNFDEPETVTNPGVTANTTIKQLKQLYTTASGEMKLITDDIIIRGIVVGNDRTGNIYKSIYIQDSTAGIQIDIDATGLYNIFPVGREVFVLAKGLYVANNAAMVKLATRVVENGTPSAAGIRGIYLDSYIKRGSLNNPVVPKVVTISQLNNDYQAMLIQLNGFEVDPADLNKTFADTSVNKSSTNINIENCSGQGIIVRTSGYASFAGQKVPQGNGNVTAIYTVFNSTKQLIIRDTTDMPLNGPRCGSGPTTLMNISDVRALFTGTPTTVPAGKRITGIVISDRSAKNIVDQNAVIQQGNNQAGIVVRFSSAHSLNLGDSVDINVSGGTLEEFSGLLQVGASTNGITVVSTGKSITPRVATIAQVNTNLEAWESTLVKVNDVTVTGGTSGNWGGNTTWNDGTGTITGFTRTGTSGATFQNTPYPTGTISSLTGIVGQFNTTKQLSLRNLSDVGTGSSGGTTLLDQNFAGVTNNADLAITGWQNIAEVGGVKFKGGTFSGESFTKITAFSSAQDVVTSWLITPAINLNGTTNEVLTFKTIDGYDNGATLKVYYS
ncbi:MAG TPA: DUF5689 domain-containing protein, partial [Chitinophagaceae bacterium]